MQLIDRRSDRLPTALRRAFTGALVVICLSTTTGWILAAHDGGGSPLECYSLRGDEIRFFPVHGGATFRSTYAVEERDDDVMIGYWEESAPGTSTMEAYGAELAYSLTRPLGDRVVVDPDGDPVPAC
jgi:hypothetical protein